MKFLSVKVGAAIARTAAVASAAGTIGVSVSAQTATDVPRTAITVTGPTSPADRRRDRAAGAGDHARGDRARQHPDRGRARRHDLGEHEFRRVQRGPGARRQRRSRDLPAPSLRGLGYQPTLVLLNGRRIANYAFTASGVDLNSIPLSAIERVEVLKDGASAIYGSDAIAGVINFILRKDYQRRRG